VIFQSLAMHPSERPATAREFRDLLLGSAAPPLRITSSILVTAPPVPQPSWGEILHHERLLIGIAGALLLVSLAISLF
jgi:hypothetical protein